MDKLTVGVIFVESSNYMAQKRLVCQLKYSRDYYQIVKSEWCYLFCRVTDAIIDTDHIHCISDDSLKYEICNLRSISSFLWMSRNSKTNILVEIGGTSLRMCTTMRHHRKC